MLVICVSSWHKLTHVFTGFKSYAPAPKKLQVPELSKASHLVFPRGTNDPVESAARRVASRDKPSKYAG